MKKPFTFAISAISLSLLSGCISFGQDAPKEVMPLGQSSFEQYVKETSQWIERNRRFATPDHQVELSHQVPFEIKPVKPNGKGILMIHGFTDSPYNFHDIANRLAERGFLVRAVVLPGHGVFALVSHRRCRGIC